MLRVEQNTKIELEREAEVNRENAVAAALREKADAKQLLAAGELAPAEDALTRAIYAVGRDPSIYAMRSLVRARRENWEGALSDAAEARAADGVASAPMRREAAAHRGLRHFDQAAHGYLRALKHSPSDPTLDRHFRALLPAIARSRAAAPSEQSPAGYWVPSRLRGRARS